MAFEVGATTEVPPTLGAVIEIPHHVKILLVMRAEAGIFPMHILRGGFQSSVNPLMEVKPADHEPEAFPALLVVIVVRAPSEVSATAMLLFSSRNSEIHVSEADTITASRAFRFLSCFCPATETGLLFLSTHLCGIPTSLLQGALLFHRFSGPCFLRNTHHATS